jgi:hypothetical protein
MAGLSKLPMVRLYVMRHGYINYPRRTTYLVEIFNFFDLLGAKNYNFFFLATKFFQFFDLPVAYRGATGKYGRENFQYFCVTGHENFQFF